MLRADAVVDAVEPGLQIGEDEVDHRHELFGHFGVAAIGNCMVVVASLAQTGIAAPIVGDDQRAWHDGTLDKATQGIGAAVDGQSHSTGIAAILPLVLCRARLPPRVLPPTHVSSTSTCSFGRPPMRSWSGRTMPARSLCRMPKAVSYRVSPSCR